VETHAKIAYIINSSYVEQKKSFIKAVFFMQSAKTELLLN